MLANTILASELTDWLSIAVSGVLSLVALIVAILAWRIQRRTLEFETRPALQVMTQRAEIPEKYRHSQDEAEKWWKARLPSQRFEGLVITNKGRGPATLLSLHYGDADCVSGLEDAFLPEDTTVFFPCQGMIVGLEKSKSKRCFVLYSDRLGKKHRLYFRINMDAMTAVPMSCVEDSGA